MQWQLNANLKFVDGIVTQALLWYDSAAPSSSARFAVELVLREALVNACLHGSRNRADAQVTLQADYSPAALQIRVCDQGCGFSFKYPLPPADALTECGRGFHIFMKYCGHVEWTDNGRSLRLIIPHPIANKQQNRITMTLIQTIRHDNQLVLVPKHNLTASMAAEFRAELRSCIDPEAKIIILDLSRVSLLDSAGIGLIIALYNSVKTKVDSFSVIEASADIHELLCSMRLDRHFAVSAASDA